MYAITSRFMKQNNAANIKNKEDLPPCDWKAFIAAGII